MVKITLSQDNHEKLRVELEERTILSEARRFFRWTKDVTMRRLYNEPGSMRYDAFIKYLYVKYG